MTPYWSDDVGPWVAGHLEYGGPYEPGTCQCMGVEHKGQLVAGVVFHNWEPEAGILELSVASINKGRWATRRVLNEIGDYAFDDLGAQMLFARQSLANEEARGLWLKLGAKEHIVPRLFGRDTIGTLLFLTDDAWKASAFYREPSDGR